MVSGSLASKSGISVGVRANPRHIAALLHGLFSLKRAFPGISGYSGTTRLVDEQIPAFLHLPLPGRLIPAFLTQKYPNFAIFLLDFPLFLTVSARFPALFSRKRVFLTFPNNFPDFSTSSGNNDFPSGFTLFLGDSDGE